MSSRLRKFAVTSLVGIILAVAMLVFFYRQVSIGNMKEHYDAHNAILAQVLANSLAHHGLDEVLGVAAQREEHSHADHEHEDQRKRYRSPSVTEEQLPEHVSQDFVNRLRQHLVDLPIFSVSLYNRDGVVVYSTVKDLLGDKRMGDPGVVLSLKGSSHGRLIRRERFNVIGLHGVVENRDFYISYIPIKDLESGEVKGALEIRSDVTMMLNKMGTVGMNIAAGVIAILGAFYAALYLLYYRLDAALQEEERERENNLRQIEMANAHLEERVSERTHELEASKLFLQSVIDGIADPIMVIDLDFHVTSMNRASLSLIPEESSLGTNVCCHELSHRSANPCTGVDHPCPFKMVLDSGEVARVTHTHSLANDEEFIVEVTASPLLDLQGNITGIVQVEHDITPMVTAANRVRESEQRFRDVSDAVGEYIWELDMEDRFIFVTDRVRDVLGYEPEEMIGKTPTDFMPEDERARVRAFFADREPRIGFRELEHTSIRKDGKLIWQTVGGVPVVDSRGSIIGSRGVCQDITQRKVFELALRESEARLRAVMDSVIDAIFTVNRDGRIESSNREAEILFRSRHADLEGTLITRHIPDIARISKAGDGEVEKLAGAGPIGEGAGEAEALCADGARFPIDLWVGRISIDEEKKFIVVARDVSERKRVEKEIEETRDQYHHQQKMAGIGHLAAGILHEVGNPIAAISGSIQEIRAQHDAEPRCADTCPIHGASYRHLQMIEEQTNRLANITHEIADFASPQRRRRELLDLNGLIRKTTSLMRYDRRWNGLDLRLDLSHDLPAINGVADQLTQIFMNILINAADATIEVPSRVSVITIRSRVVSERVSVSVADNGCGMDSQTLVSARDAFYTTKPVGKGTGLGLSLCDSIVNAHHGLLEIESTLGEGTTVNLYLPIDDVETEEA